MSGFIDFLKKTGANIQNALDATIKHVYFDVDTDRLSDKDHLGNTRRYLIDGDLAGVGRFQGVHDASTGLVPTGPLTPIKAGDKWTVSVGGTIVGLSGEDKKPVLISLTP